MWLVDQVEGLRKQGLNNNEVKHVLRTKFPVTARDIEDAIMVADAHDEQVLDMS